MNINPITVRPAVAAQMLGMCRRTFDGLASDGRGPLRCSQNPVLYRVAELERWAAEQQEKLNVHHRNLS
jgi:hypothetical protein